MKKHTSAALMTKDDLHDWLVDAIARKLQIDPEEIDAAVAYDRYGMDSVAAVELTGELEKRLGRRLSPTLMYDYPTVDALSRHLADELRAAASGALAAGGA
jgi:acyl carrier protein